MMVTFRECFNKRSFNGTKVEPINETTKYFYIYFF